MEINNEASSSGDIPLTPKAEIKVKKRSEKISKKEYEEGFC